MPDGDAACEGEYDDDEAAGTPPLPLDGYAYGKAAPRVAEEGDAV
jgi:hypothetical protein